MKIKKCIFAKIISVIAVGAIVAGAFVAPAANAAVDNTGCDNEYNIYINPELALCSTHVYNIGLTQNPTDSAHRQLMQDVVGLKTTLITQQMYSQYEILAATVKRLRTQLQKEVLLARLKTAGAIATGGSGASNNNTSASNDKYIVLANAENCLDISGGTKAGLECLIRNLDRVVAAANSGDTGNAKRQLMKDLDALNMYNVTVKDSKNELVAPIDGISECDKLKNSAKRDDVITCARKSKIAVTQKLEQENQNNQRRTPMVAY